MSNSKIVTVDFRTDSNALTLELFFETVLEENIRSFLKETQMFEDCKNEYFWQTLNIFSKYRNGILVLESEKHKFEIHMNIFTSFIEFRFIKLNWEQWNSNFNKLPSNYMNEYNLKIKFDSLFRFEFDVEYFLSNFTENYLGQKNEERE